MKHPGLKKSRLGQNTVEYILLVSAVIAVILFMTSGRDSTFQNKLVNTVNTTLTGMENQAQKLTNSVNH